MMFVQVLFVTKLTRHVFHLGVALIMLQSIVLERQ